MAAGMAEVIIVDSIRSVSRGHPQTILSVGILAVGSVRDVPGVCVMRHSGVLDGNVGRGTRGESESLRDVRGPPDGEMRGVENSTESTAQHQGLLAFKCQSYNWSGEEVTKGTSRWRIHAGVEFPEFLPEKL